MKTPIKYYSTNDPMELRFLNGVYDLKEMKFRSFTDDEQEANQQANMDRVMYGFSSNCGYDYHHQRDPEKEKLIMKYWRQVLQDEKEREYYLTCLGSCLEGYNQEHMVLAMTGTCASKSTSCELVGKTLGSYCRQMFSQLGEFCPAKDIENFFNGNIRRETYQELVQLIGCRIVFSNIDHYCGVDWEKMDWLTSNIHIGFRPLYDNPSTTHLQFTPILIFDVISDYNNKSVLRDYQEIMPDKLDPKQWQQNVLDQLPEMAFPVKDLLAKIHQGDTCGRVKPIQFKSKFTQNPNYFNGSGNEFQQIPRYSARFTEWRLSFFHILTDYYRKYRAGGLPEPPELCHAN